MSVLCDNKGKIYIYSKPQMYQILSIISLFMSIDYLHILKV